ncbi:MAG: RecQ family ATP-dependent DNA helicase [Acidobacteriota bacterium]
MDGRCCGTAAAALGDEIAAAPAPPSGLAYALAWLRAAGSGSVLPAWVRHRHPELPRLLDRLRHPAQGPGSCASRGACTYCRGGLGAVSELRRHFGFEGFRPEPRADDGSPLQRRVVEAGLEGRPLLALMPTGAGKSLCFQLPALVHHARRGRLTVVVSPLQALMRDQVEGLHRNVGGGRAAALYGLLTPPERGRVLERVRLGEIGILYVAPEQLRNRSFRDAVRQREIATWVFDEAHCLSKWGHDFRPDYLYAARFVRELAESQGSEPPPVACLTATAKVDVVEEIRDHFVRELGQELEIFAGPVDRAELQFEVETASGPRKTERIAELVRSRDGGSAVVYCATRRSTAELARQLEARGIAAAAFHAGLGAAEKRRVLEGFSSGESPVVVATNAFGMGIDKDDVRLVVHADVPGSLESYLQEAGRAGRDRRPARCVLLFDDEAVEAQFRLSASSRLGFRDMVELLRLIRHRITRLRSGDLVLTPGELLRGGRGNTGLRPGDERAATKVKAAVAWLERTGFVERLQNQTRVFQGRLKVQNLDVAKTVLEGLGLDPRTRRRWTSILEALFDSDPQGGVSADLLGQLAEPGEGTGGPAGVQILRDLAEMTDKGLLSAGLQLSAHLVVGGPTASKRVLEQAASLERHLLDVMQETDPDAAPGDDDGASPGLPLSLRQINQRILDRDGGPSHPERLLDLLSSLAEDGRGLAKVPKPSLTLRRLDRDRHRIWLRRSWASLVELADLRLRVASVVLETLVGRGPDGAKGALVVDFALEDLVRALKTNLALGTRLRDPVAAAERGLLFLHEQGAIQLQNGLAVFRQAMTLRLRGEAKGRPFRKGDYGALQTHYSEQMFQIHAMARYARTGLEAMERGLALVRDYFQDNRGAFARTWFPEEGDVISRATSAESYRDIVEDLGNPEQIAVVAAPEGRNLLVLAGPGSGKTRVVVHRCAYLLRVERVPPRSILVLCFNRNAALDLRRRLLALAGDDARGVTVCTYHALALRLVGRSFATEASREGGVDLDTVIPEAVDLLRNPGEPTGFDDELRDRMLAGYRHILVDEYQDIDENQYRLVSQIAGKGRDPGERVLSILAVGDDDQTIYGWKDANVEFIRRFHGDYGAEVHHLVQCYRSTGHIVAAAAKLIAHNRDRMKVDHPIRVDDARRREAPGGVWASREPGRAGRVQWVRVTSGGQQAEAVAGRIEALRSLHPELELRDIAVLGRSHRALEPTRALLEHRGIQVAWSASRDHLPSLHRIREVGGFLDALARDRRRQVTAAELCDLEQRLHGNLNSPWRSLLAELLGEWRDLAGEASAPAQDPIEFLYEALAERRREPMLGDGVRLSTVHAAKGLEFAHVFLLDGGWVRPDLPSKLEEERRLYYVGMTRARETLWLGSGVGGPNVHAQLVVDPSPRSRDGVLVEEAPAAAVSPEMLRRRFGILGLRDIFLSWPARGGGEGCLRALGALRYGSALELRRDGSRGLLVDGSGVAVARLSGKGWERWGPRLDRILGIRVVAMVRWRAEDDSDPERRAALTLERWEVPVAEVVWRGSR